MEEVVIIAEAGVNHNGSVEIAKKLIDVAANSGADFVKFQTFIAEKVISRHAKKAEYQIENTGLIEETQLDMVKKLELTPAMHDELINYCKQKNINFLSTAFDLDSIDLLKKLNLPFFKIPSGEITNLPYLRKVALNFDKIVMSTGMAYLKEVKEAFEVLITMGIKREHITILHCNTEYPTKMEDVNLKAMLQIQNEFGTSVGYSDHTLGIEVPIAAVALGANVIEKHFTLDRNMSGPDHVASLEPNELMDMVTSIRNITRALGGSGIKEPSKSELKNISIARKSIHVNRDVKSGEILKEEDLVVLRPNNGISPMEWDNVIGRCLKANVMSGNLLSLDDLL
ncbi:MAG: N-acetylneuraminate synthase [Bacteroidetes bacterium]|nr:MAG: N-acetylneuraminate synthase [Bacteroidota bacterium]